MPYTYKYLLGMLETEEDLVHFFAVHLTSL